MTTPIVIAGILAVAATHAAPPAFPDRCAVDRERLLALDRHSFDQGPTGWRALAKSGCHAAAADIIGDWLRRNAASDTILSWHEGQMRANAGQYDRAIILFERSRKKRSMEMAQAWNLYVDGSIAFLRADRPALERARNRLARTPKPAGFNPVDSDGRPLDMPWPPNLPALESFLRCWGAPYLRAYSCRHAR